VRLTTRSRRLASAMAPRLEVRQLTRDYDLFFPVFNNAFELFALLAVPDWRKRCRVAACFVSEMWAHDIPEYLLRRVCAEGRLEHRRIVNALWISPAAVAAFARAWRAKKGPNS